MKETQIDRLEWLLRTWANWEIRFMTGNAGWPVTSAMILALQYSSDFKTKQYGSKLPPFNEVADHMRYLIDTGLQKDLPHCALAIKAVYLNPELSQSEVAFQNKVSYRTLQKWLYEAKIYLRGCIRNDPFFK